MRRMHWAYGPLWAGKRLQAGNAPLEQTVLRPRPICPAARFDADLLRTLHTGLREDPGILSTEVTNSPQIISGVGAQAAGASWRTLFYRYETDEGRQFTEAILVVTAGHIR